MPISFVPLAVNRDAAVFGNGNGCESDKTDMAISVALFEAKRTGDSFLVVGLTKSVNGCFASKLRKCSQHKQYTLYGRNN